MRYFFKENMFSYALSELNNPVVFGHIRLHDTAPRLPEGLHPIPFLIGRRRTD